MIVGSIERIVTTSWLVLNLNVAYEISIFCGYESVESLSINFANKYQDLSHKINVIRISLLMVNI